MYAKLIKYIPIIVFTIISLFCLYYQPQATLPKTQHGYLSSHGLALASNLFTHDFFMFDRIDIETGNKVIFSPYNRFNFLPFALIKWAGFTDNLVENIYWTHQLMNLFFLACGFVAFLIFTELGFSPMKAVIISLLSFSSRLVLTYKDMIFNDTFALFSVLLTTLLILKYKKQQVSKLALYFVVAVSLCLGWQVFMTLLAWVIIETFFSKKLRTESLKLFTYAGCVCVLILGFALTNEMRVTNTKFIYLPSVRSILLRLGAEKPLTQMATNDLKPAQFLQTQTYRAYIVSLDRILGKLKINLDIFSWQKYLFYFVVFTLVVFLIIQRNRDPLRSDIFLIFIFSSIFWSLGMKNFTAFHEFQSIFWMGLSLAMCGFVINYLPSKFAPLLVLILAVDSMSAIKRYNESKLNEGASSIVYLKDLDMIHKTVGTQKKVYSQLDLDQLNLGAHTLEYFLAGNFFTTTIEQAEYVIWSNPQKKPEGTLLTPLNNGVFVTKVN